MNRHLIPAIFVTALLLVICGCSSSADKSSAAVEEGQAAVEEEHVYEYGIPVDLYSMEEGEIAKGDIFASLLGRLGVENSVALKLAEMSKPVFDVRNIQVGKEYHAFYRGAADSAQLAYLVYEHTPLEVVVFNLNDTLGVERMAKTLDSKVKYVEVEINSSLWMDTQKAGCSPLVALKLSDIYAWSIDFFALQKGDRFAALYECTEKDGRTVDIGKVLYCDFVHDGKSFKCYWFDGEEGGNQYWNENGESLRKAFLKAPLNYSRISSSFSYARKHPVTRRVQPHTGVDYAAPTGTPVVAIGDGVVTSAKYEGAGGNTVRIKHNSVYRTAYLHLSKYGKGIKAGARVSQGQIIGYVGSTGRSTGPHLDFRIWQNDKPVNPLKMVSPPANPVSEKNRAAFEERKARAVASRDSLMIEGYYQQLILGPLGE